jgi:hypothetical protein
MSSRTPHAICLALVCSLSVFLAPLRPAHAQSSDERMREVKRACAAGDVDRAIRMLADLYADTNDATAIYNQARCYQQNGQSDKASLRFREYLRKARDLSPHDRAEVEGFIREADADVAAKERARAAAPAQPAPHPAPAATPVAPAPQPMPLQVVAEPVREPERPSRRKGLMIAGFITFGVSYALTAIVGAALATSPSADCSNCKAVGEEFYVPLFGPWIALASDAQSESSEDIYGSSSRTDLTSVALLGAAAQTAGAVMTGVGILLFVKSGRREPPPVALQVLPTRGGMLGSVRGSF